MKRRLSILIVVLWCAASTKAGNSSAHDLVIDENGTILTVGVATNVANTTATQTLNSSDFTLVRYLPSGALDTTFNPFGTIPGILRFNLSNQVQTFGGILEPVNEGLTSVALTKDHEIVAAGFYTVGLNSNVAVLKLTQNGALDTTFNANGRLGATPGMSVIDVGQFLVANNVATGVTQDTAADVAIDSQGRVVIVGSTNDGQFISVLVIRLTPQGELDTTFNPGGTVPGIFTYSVVQENIRSNISASAVAITADDSIVVGGTVNGSSTNNSVVSSNFFIMKLTPVGSLDATFNPAETPPGIVQQNFQGFFNQAFALKLDKDENIVIAGSSQQFFGGSSSSTGGALTLFALARYTQTGVLDTTFNANGLSLGQPGTVLTSISQHSDSINGLAISEDGTIVATGVSNNGLNKVFATARYLTTGVLDPAFNPAGELPGVILTQVEPIPQYNMTPTIINTGTAVAIGTDNQLYVSGISYDGFQTNITLLNYLKDGMLNASVFNPTGLLSNVPGVVVTPIGQSLTIQGNGTPIYVTEDVSRVSPAILETLKQPFELIEPVITTDMRAIRQEKQVTLAGYASPNALITIYVNGFESGRGIARYMGEWSVTLPPLLDGLYEIHAVAQDPLSGITLSSLPVQLKVNTLVPQAPTIENPEMDEIIDSGIITVEGTAQPKTSVMVYLDKKEYSRVQTSDTGRWSARLSNIPEGDHSITALAVSKDGVQSTPSLPVSFGVDVSGEEEPRITSPEQGFTAHDSVLLVKGAGAPGTTIKLYANNRLIQEIPVDKEGYWSFRMTNLEGAYELYAASAIKGYTSSKVSGKVVLHPLPLQDQGNSEDLLQGQASPGGMVRIYQGAEYLGMTKVDKQGRWSYTPSTQRVRDNQPIKIVIYDAQGRKQSTLEKRIRLPR